MINLLFSTSDIEKAAQKAFYSGMPLNTNPFIGKRTWVGKLKCKLWECAFLRAERDNRGV